MKVLFWKEWRELRYAGLRPLSAIFTFMIVLLLALCDHATAHRVGWTAWQVDADLLRGCVAAVAVFGAATISAGLISREVGDGSLPFLTLLPVSRRKIWWTKTLAGLCAVVVSTAGTVVGFLAAIWVLGLLGMAHSEYGPLLHIEFATAGIVAAAIMASFSTGLFASPLFDRTTGATAAAVLLLFSVGGTAVFIFSSGALANLNGLWTSPSYGTSNELGGVPYNSAYADQTLILFCWIVAICGFAITRASYRAFTRGETLKSGWRYLEALLGISEVLWWLVAFPALAVAWFIW